MVVGDDDQLIYVWCGVWLENLVRLQEDWLDLKVVKLEQNYCFIGCILKVVNMVIVNNFYVFEKSLWFDYGYGEVICIVVLCDEDGEIDWIVGDIFYWCLQCGLYWKDFVVFYWGNFQLWILEMKLQVLQIFYKVFGGIGFFFRGEIKDLMCYLCLLVNLDDDNVFLCVINMLCWEIGLVILEKLVGWVVQWDQGFYYVCDDFVLGEVMVGKVVDKLCVFKIWLDEKCCVCFGYNSL